MRPEDEYPDLIDQSYLSFFEAIAYVLKIDYVHDHNHDLICWLMDDIDDARSNYQDARDEGRPDKILQKFKAKIEECRERQRKFNKIRNELIHEIQSIRKGAHSILVPESNMSDKNTFVSFTYVSVCKWANNKYGVPLPANTIQVNDPKTGAGSVENRNRENEHFPEGNDIADQRTQHVYLTIHLLENAISETQNDFQHDNGPPRKSAIAKKLLSDFFGEETVKPRGMLSENFGASDVKSELLRESTITQSFDKGRKAAKRPVAVEHELTETRTYPKRLLLIGALIEGLVEYSAARAELPKADFSAPHLDTPNDVAVHLLTSIDDDTSRYPNADQLADILAAAITEYEAHLPPT